MKDFFENGMILILVGLFNIVIVLSQIEQWCKFAYYTVFRIKFIKQRGKFHTYYMRIK